MKQSSSAATRTRRGFGVRVLVLILLLFSGVKQAAAQAETLPGFDDEVVLQGLKRVLAFAFFPGNDTRCLLMRKNGQLAITDVGVAPAVAQDYLTVTAIKTSFERGTAGLLLHPEFPSQPYIYIYYMSSATDSYRLSRFTHVESSGGLASYGDLDSEVVVWHNPEPPLDCCHFGGAMTIGPEGALYLATGDNYQPELAQDLTSPSGKILRMWLNGTAVADNLGLADGPGGHLDMVWAYGLRNPFSTTWDEVSGRLLIAEVGGRSEVVCLDVQNRTCTTDFPACIFGT